MLDRASAFVTHSKRWGVRTLATIPSLASAAIASVGHHLFLNMSLGCFAPFPVGLNSLSKCSTVGSRKGTRASRCTPSQKLMRAAGVCLGVVKSMEGEWTMKEIYIPWFWGVECRNEHGKKLRVEIFLYNFLHTRK